MARKPLYMKTHKWIPRMCDSIIKNHTNDRPYCEYFHSEEHCHMKNYKVINHCRSVLINWTIATLFFLFFALIISLIPADKGFDDTFGIFALYVVGIPYIVIILNIYPIILLIAILTSRGQYRCFYCDSEVEKKKLEKNGHPENYNIAKKRLEEAEKKYKEDPTNENLEALKHAKNLAKIESRPDDLDIIDSYK